MDKGEIMSIDYCEHYIRLGHVTGNFHQDHSSGAWKSFSVTSFSSNVNMSLIQQRDDLLNTFR